MAAGHQKKRFNSATLVSCNLQEPYRWKKKKNMELSRWDMRPHISLKWDDIQKRAVAKKDQIGISWRDVGPFVGSALQSHMGLADVIPIPQEIFGLENLTRVLSYEVWETHLSESEKKFLIQFLPTGSDVDEVVQGLLNGENFHFGNPFLTWGALLCSGDLHPDTVLQSDKHFKANKKAYYAELQKYHNDILENLQKWKERWIRCKDPEKDIVEKMWRCRRKNAENSLSSHPNGSIERDLEENHTATADSCSGVADEQVCITNKERPSTFKGGEPQERKGSMKQKQGNSSISSVKGKVVLNSGKEEKPQNVFVRSSDTAKYMSYIKISRKQHQLVKKIKHSGEGIQSKSLNRVLGDIKSFNVQSYKTFEEEEQKKLLDYWSKLAIRDLPAAFANRGKRLLQIQQWRKSLEQEITSKKKIVMDEDEKERDPKQSVQEQGDCCREINHEPTINVQNSKIDNESFLRSNNCPPLLRIPSLNRPHEPEPMVMDSDDSNQETLKQEENAPIPSQFLEKTSPTVDLAEPDSPSASAKDIWQVVGMPDSYYHPTSVTHGYASSTELPVTLRKSQPVEEQPTCMIDLETNMPEQEAGKPLLHGSSDKASMTLRVDSRSPLVSTYSSQDHSGLLPPFLKGQGILPSFPEEPMGSLKQEGLQFLTANEGPRESGQFLEQFQGEQQQQLFEERQHREKELYMHQIMQKNMYSNGRYPNQELFPSPDVQEWSSDPVRTAPFQSPVNGGMLNQDWFSGDHQARNGWSATEVSGSAGQCLGGGSSNTDGSLFSVLSQCNKLQSNSRYKSETSEPYSTAQNFVGGGISNNDIFTYTPHQTNYTSTREAATTATTPWMNLPRPNLGPHDSIEKPFLRSWNK